MSCGDLAARDSDLMTRARQDLAELVSFRSVADPTLFAPAECEAAASWPAEAFVDAGLADIEARETPWDRRLEGQRGRPPHGAAGPYKPWGSAALGRFSADRPPMRSRRWS